MFDIVFKILGMIVVFNLGFGVIATVMTLVTKSHELPTKEWRDKYKEWKHGQGKRGRR